MTPAFRKVHIFEIIIAKRKKKVDMKREMIEGQRFGKWEVLSYDGCYEHKKSYYFCRCTGCGEIYRVRADKMKAGWSTQCVNCARKQRGKSQDKNLG